jgi:hypothetical protein
LSNWDNFFYSDEEFETKRGTDEFKRIQACYEATKAYKLFLDKLTTSSNH